MGGEGRPGETRGRQARRDEGSRWQARRDEAMAGGTKGGEATRALVDSIILLSMGMGENKNRDKEPRDEVSVPSDDRAPAALRQHNLGNLDFIL